MGKHRDQAKFDRAEWKLRILLPCWVAQISLLLILLGISAYLLANAMKDDVEVRGTAIAYVHIPSPRNSLVTLAIVKLTTDRVTYIRWEAINIGYSVIAVLLTGFEMIRTILECLTPKNLLSANLAKLFGVILCMIMDGLVTGTDLNGWADGTFVIHSLLM